MGLKGANAAAPLAATLMLLAPALWNGFPLLEYDTGGYLARWFEGTLEVSRSTVYGLYLVAFGRPDFWPAVVVQAALTVWVIVLMLRAHKLGGRPIVLLVTVAVLSVATTLPWLASLLLTDIFAGLGVLALYLVVFHADTLMRWERAAVTVLIGFSAATHSATVGVMLALLAAGLVVACLRPRLMPIAGIGRGVAALVLGAIILIAANYGVARQIAWTPGGVALSFGRMLQDGIVARFLAEHCPDPRFRLCDHRDELPDGADAFFWGEGVFDRLGSFQGLNAEMRTIVLESLRDYPLWQLATAVRATARQLVAVRTGEGVLDSTWHTHRMIERFTPAALPAMRAARQQKGELDFDVINALHAPVALASMLLLLGTIALALRRNDFADLGVLAVTAALAILANAAVCGVLANPHDRYGARLVWIAVFVIAMLPWRMTRRLAAKPRWLDQRVAE